ncbi:hypothetical protein NT07LI_3760, partial [Listeria innocua FSL S4-378]
FNDFLRVIRVTSSKSASELLPSCFDVFSSGTGIK